MNSFTSAATRTLNRMIHKMGHVLTLAASLVLWCGIYSTIPSGASDSTMSAESELPEHSQHVSSEVSQQEEQDLTQVVADKS